jgi:YbbR domain-containing protein
VVNIPQKSLKTSLTISARRSLINSIDSSDLSAFVDVSTAKDEGDRSFSINVRAVNPEITVVMKNPSSVSLYIDKIITVQKPVRISYNGNLGTNFYIDRDKAVINPPMASIRVPELLADKISEAVVNIDMTDIEKNLSGDFDFMPVDQNGEEIQNKNISPAHEKINVKVPVLKRKTVPITLKNLPPAQNFDINPATAEIAGEEAVIDGIEYIEGYIDGYSDENLKKSYPVNLKLDNFIQIDKNEITAYLLEPQTQE